MSNAKSGFLKLINRQSFAAKSKNTLESRSERIIARRYPTVLHLNTIKKKIFKRSIARVVSIPSNAKSLTFSRERTNVELSCLREAVHTYINSSKA